MSLRILIIDEEQETLDFVVNKVLLPQGFHVHAAPSGVDGLRQALTDVLDIILLSVDITKVTSVELLEELRHFNGSLPVILLVPERQETIPLELLRLGIHNYVSKPIDSEELLNTIENTLCVPILRVQKRELFSRNVMQTNQRLQQRIQSLNALYNISKSITSLQEPNKILDRIVDAVIFILDGEECSIMLLDPQTSQSQDYVVKRRELDHEEVAVRANMDDASLIESVLSVPLQVGTTVVGIMSLTKLISGRFTSHDAQSLRMLADYAAIAIHNMQLMKQLKETQEKEQKHLRGLFEKYVAPSVVQQLLNEPDKVKLGGTHQSITVLFADVRGFSTFSERTPPERLVKLLNHYMTVAADAVLAEEGTLDKFMGDAVMAFFNAPMPQSDHLLRALRAAWVLNEQVKDLHQRLPKRYHLHFGVGVGVGQALVGNIGTPQMMNFTAIGDAVNKVKRLQENAQGGQILIAQETFRLVEEHVGARYLGDLHLKGQRQPEPVYEVIWVGHR